MLLTKERLNRNCAAVWLELELLSVGVIAYSAL